MTLPVLAIRPEPGCSATVEAGRKLGLQVSGFPMFVVRPVPWDAPSLDSFDALLVGSANAFRHGGARLAALRSKLVFVVGEATASAAREAGFEVGAIGEGGLQGVLDDLDRPLRLLRVAGSEHVPLTVPEGTTIDTRIVYTTEPLPMLAEMANVLSDGAVVMLHSAAAARHFSAECRRLDMARDRVHLAAIGPRVEAAAEEGWASRRSAARPHDSALLALANEMCHEPPRA